MTVINHDLRKYAGEWLTPDCIVQPLADPVTAKVRQSEDQWHQARIAEVVALMRRFGVSVEEVSEAMNKAAP